MTCDKPYKNPKGTYRIWYYRATLGGRVRLSYTVSAWDQAEAIRLYHRDPDLGKYKHIDEVEKIN